MWRTVLRFHKWQDFAGKPAAGSSIWFGRLTEESPRDDQDLRRFFGILTLKGEGKNRGWPKNTVSEWARYYLGAAGGMSQHVREFMFSKDKARNMSRSEGFAFLMEFVRDPERATPNDICKSGTSFKWGKDFL